MVYLSVLSVPRVYDTLVPGAVFRGLPPGLPGGGGKWPHGPAFPIAHHGQAFEDTMSLVETGTADSVYMLFIEKGFVFCFVFNFFLKKKRSDP